MEIDVWEWNDAGVEIECGGARPVQAFGTVDGLPVYFRARGESWSFRIASEPGGDPVGVGWGTQDGWMTEGEYGVLFDAERMPGEHSRAIVTACVNAWRGAGGKL